MLWSVLATVTCFGYTTWAKIRDTSLFSAYISYTLFIRSSLSLNTYIPLLLPPLTLALVSCANHMTSGWSMVHGCAPPVVFHQKKKSLLATLDMFKTIVTGSTRLLSHAAPLRTSAAKAVPDLAPLKFDSNGSSSLYAICKIHNMPYLVSKGDRLVLPYKMKNVKVGDVLKLNNVTSIGSRNFTFNDDNGIPELAFELTATLAEITREPKYQVYKKKQRCRRLKTVDVEPYQTHLVISELKLK